jgi:hypothetical protein
VPALDRQAFEQYVEPELMGSCGFSRCHGAEGRPLRIFALAGTRVSPSLSSNNPLTPEEHLANYQRAVSLAAATAAELPDLLRKPLQLEAGGSGHGGVDRFGQNVFASREDPRWTLLDDWVHGRLVADAGEDGGADAGSGDGGRPPFCAPAAGPSFTATIAPIVNPTRCGDTGCHVPGTHWPDAGCFDPGSCGGIRTSGCQAPALLTVEPCNLFDSRLYRYTGVPPFYKSHQARLLPQHAAAIAAWIDGGAPCDDGTWDGGTGP